MSDTSHIDRTIQDACAEVDRLMAEVVRKKIGVNTICELFSRPPIYADIDTPQRTAISGGRPDRFVNKPLATVAKSVLAARHASEVGPATIDELYQEMLRGGYDFKGKSEDNAKLGLSVSLAKNTKTFYKVRDGLWGLAEWYGITSRRKKVGNGDEAAETETEDENLLDGVLDETVKAEEFGVPETADQETVETAKAVKG